MSVAGGTISYPTLLTLPHSTLRLTRVRGARVAALRLQRSPKLWPSIKSELELGPPSVSIILRMRVESSASASNTAFHGLVGCCCVRCTWPSPVGIICVSFSTHGLGPHVRIVVHCGRCINNRDMAVRCNVTASSCYSLCISENGKPPKNLTLNPQPQPQPCDDLPFLSPCSGGGELPPYPQTGLIAGFQCRSRVFCAGEAASS